MATTVPAVSVTTHTFGKLSGVHEPDLAGADVTAHVLSSGSLHVTVLDFGATITSIKLDGAGELSLCFPDLPALEDLKRNPFFGCTVGRYANRIAGGVFHVDGVEYRTPITFRGQSSHGGVRGWNRYLWRIAASGVREQGGVMHAYVTYEHASPDGNEGFPGAVTARATYSVSADNVLGMTFEADTDAATPLNMCNHAYYNMSGDVARDITGHSMALYADEVVEVDEVTQIPTGKLQKVAEAPLFDFTHARVLSETLTRVTGGEQVGYDHSYVVGGDSAPAPLREAAAAYSERHAAPGLRPCATLSEAAARMHVYTTQPCVHLYTTNFLKGTPPYDTHYGVCLETQAPPDAVNQPRLGCGDAIVRPRSDGVPAYRHVTLHAFEKA